MSRGGKFLTATAVLAMAACSMDQGKLEIRSTPTALAQGARPVPQRIAEARGQLALGNVGLALEAYRLASREDPNSTDALAGMASCYDRMGRFDLSRRYYETALALAPADTQLLSAFAASLQLQGLTEEAISVRQEIAARSAPTSQPVEAAPEVALHAPGPAPAPELAALSPVSAGSTVLPPKMLASTFAMAPAEAPAEASAPLPVREFATPAVQLAETKTPTRVAVSVPVPAPAPVVEEAPAPVAVAAPVGQSVTIKLPPAHRVQTVAPAVAPVPPVALAAPAPVATPDSLAPIAVAETAIPALKPGARPISEPSVAKEHGPRLERLSLAEIGLVTTSGPVWRSTTVAQTASSAKVRFIPVREASTLPVKVRLLNAARIDRLAARTRSWLAGKGWRGMAIGNAYAARQRSVILYSADTRWLAQRLSKQFGFPMAPKKGSAPRQVMVLLGTDASRHPALKRRA